MQLQATTTSTLTTVESSRLAELETTIKRGMETFVAVGQALSEIREGRLYRASHSTFEAYCRERWGWSHRHANRVIGAAKVAGQLGPMGPISERALRPVTTLPPAQRAKVVESAKAKAGEGPVKTKHIRAAVVEVLPTPPRRTKTHLDEGLEELEEWRKRYHSVRAFVPIFEAIDAVMVRCSREEVVGPPTAAQDHLPDGREVVERDQHGPVVVRRRATA